MPVFGPERVGTDRHHLQAGMAHADVCSDDLRDQLTTRSGGWSPFSATTQAAPVLLPHPYLRCAQWTNADPAFPEAHSVQSLLPT
jgi:hypothetical protein